MKFTTYQPATSDGGVLHAPAYRVTRDINAYGGNGIELAALNRGIGVIAAAVEKRQDDADAADVMDARNQIMTKITEGLYSENGLLATGVGENAKGLTERVTTLIKDTSRDVMSKKNARVQLALKKNLSENFQNFQRMAASQEMREGKAAEQATYNSLQENNRQVAALNYKSPEILASMIKQQGDLAAAQSIREGWNGATLVAAHRDNTTKTVAGCAQAAIDAGDYQTAGNILDTYRKDIDQKVYGKLYQTIRKQENMRTRDTFVSDVMARHKLPDGTYDMASVKEEIEAKSGRYARKDGIKNKEEFFYAVAGQESGGNYEAENGRTGAYGKYQIMPENWPNWSKEAGLPEGAQPTPENQEIVAKYKLGDYFDKYGPEGALVAWYAGEQNGARWAAGKKTAMGEDGEYSWDAPQGNGDEPSVREYVQQTLGRVRSDISAYDPEERDKMWRLAESIDADNSRLLRQEKERHEKDVFHAVEAAESMAEAQNIIDNDDTLSPAQKNSLMGYAKKKFKVTAKGGRSRGEKAYDPKKDMDVLDDAARYLNLEDMDNPQDSRKGFTESQWVKIKKAVERLDQSGAIEQSIGSDAYQTYYDIWNENVTDPKNMGVEIRDLIQQEFRAGATPGEIMRDMQESFGIDSAFAMMILSSADYSLVEK